MWYMKCSWTLLVFVALFALVTGSCLEYGHSCWGAHGKRSGGKAAVAAAQTVGNPLAVETLAEQLYNNNQNNNNNNNPEDTDDDANTNNNNISLNNMPPRASALSAQSGDNEERNRNHRNHEANDLKWTQLMRQQHRYQLRQQQKQQSRLAAGGQYDAAAESWRKLQQALLMAQAQAQAQVEAEAEGEGMGMADAEQQQQQQQTLSELYELKK